MSYTIHVSCTSPAARNDVLDFVSSNMRPAHSLWPHLVGLPDHGIMSGPMTGKDLSLSRATLCDIGYHYNAGFEPEERNYAYGLVRWMALRVGKRKFFQLNEHSGIEAPYYLYEKECHPVIVATEHPEIPDGWNEEWDLVNADGFTPSHRLDAEMYAEMAAEAKAGNETSAFRMRGPYADPDIQAELHRLTTLWDARVPPKRRSA